MFFWKNKLAPYTADYQCPNDCQMWGCSGHKARFELNSVSDIFKITFRLDEEGERTVYFNLAEFGLIEDFMFRLKNDGE